MCYNGYSCKFKECRVDYMEVQVKIDAFEGPLDLLLHFVKESKVDILEISIVDIANQYLDFIHQMESLNLNIASEYLVMASELIEIKSRKLLPRKEVEEENQEEEDPETALINRLIEYQKYKDMTKSFKEMEELRQEIFTKTPESLKEYSDTDVVVSSDVTLDDLVLAFQKFLKRKEEEKPLSTKVTKNEITIEQRRSEIKGILRKYKRVDFVSLFEVCTREYVVVTFLTILEMAKQKEVLIKQDSNFENIIVEVV